MLERNRAASVVDLAAIASLTLTACAEGGMLQGEDAASQQHAIDLFATKFGEVDSALPYNVSGSGSGQTQFIAGTVASVGPDSPLKEKDGENQVVEARKCCDGNDVWHLPVVIGPAATAYNLGGTGVALTPALVAEIFDGKVTKQNDLKIARADKNVKLPEEDIKAVYRPEESSTTDDFMEFLNVVVPDQWKHETSKSFPIVTGQGADGSAGVVDEVSSIDDAITYAETGFTKGRNLDIAKVDLGHGPAELNNDTVGKALDSVTSKTEGHDMVVDTDALFAMDENGAYPLILITYEIVYSVSYDEETRDLVKSFLKVAPEESQGPELRGLGYIPVQNEFKDKLPTAINVIK